MTKRKKKNPAEFDLLGYLANKMRYPLQMTEDGHWIDNPLYRANYVLQNSGNSNKTKPIPAWLYDKLDRLGIIPNDIRNHNVGDSDYSQHLIQPWSIWVDYDLNPWDADIVKRVLREKKTEKRISDYKKIIHICQERIRQLEIFEKQSKDDDERTKA